MPATGSYGAAGTLFQPHKPTNFSGFRPLAAAMKISSNRGIMSILNAVADAPSGEYCPHKTGEPIFALALGCESPGQQPVVGRQNSSQRRQILIPPLRPPACLHLIQSFRSILSGLDQRRITAVDEIAQLIPAQK